MRVATRFFFERLAMLDRLIRAGEYPSARVLADRLEVSRRTILRDVEMARDRLGIPLAYDARRRGFTYTDATYRLALTVLTDADLAALRTAQSALEPFGGLPDGADLARAARKVTLGLIDRPSHEAEPHPARSFRFSAGSRSEPDRFLLIDRAIRRRERVAIRYYSASSDAESDREVDPYHVVSIDGRWFLVAFCHRRGEVRMFALNRIRTWSPTAGRFEPPGSFSIDHYLGRTIGMLRGGADELHTVRLRFRGAAVRYAREQTWQADQVAGPTPEGDWLVRFEVSHLREVERLALSWGADCLVLAPAELRDRVARAHAEAAAMYDETNPSPPSVACP